MVVVPMILCATYVVDYLPCSLSRSRLSFFIHSKMLLIRVLRLKSDRSGGMPTYTVGSKICFTTLCVFHSVFKS